MQLILKALCICIVVVSVGAELWTLPCLPLVHLTPENCSNTVAVLHGCDATRTYRSSVIVLIAPATAGGGGRSTVSNLTLVIFAASDVNVVVQDVALEHTLISIADSARRASLSCSASVVAAYSGVCRTTALSMRNVSGRNVSVSVTNYTVDADVGWVSIENTTLVASRVTLQRVSRSVPGAAHPMVLSGVALVQSLVLVADATCIDSVLLASVCVLQDQSAVSLLSSVVLALPTAALRNAVRLLNVTALRGSSVDVRSATISSRSTASSLVSVASCTFSVASSFAVHHSLLTSLGGGVARLLEVSDTTLGASSEVLVHGNAFTSATTVEHVTLRKLLVLSSSVSISSNTMALNVTRGNVGVLVLGTSTLFESDVMLHNNTWALMSPAASVAVGFFMVSCELLSSLVTASQLSTGSSTTPMYVVAVQSCNMTGSVLNVSDATVRVGYVSFFSTVQLRSSYALFSNCRAVGPAASLQLWDAVNCVDATIAVLNSSAVSGSAQPQRVAVRWTPSSATRTVLNRSLLSIRNCVLQGTSAVQLDYVDVVGGSVVVVSDVTASSTGVAMDVQDVYLRGASVHVVSCMLQGVNAARFAFVDVLDNSTVVFSNVTASGPSTGIGLSFKDLYVVSSSSIVVNASRLSGGNAVYVNGGYLISNSSFVVDRSALQSALPCFYALGLTMVNSSAVTLSNVVVVTQGSAGVLFVTLTALRDCAIMLQSSTVESAQRGFVLQTSALAVSSCALLVSCHINATRGAALGVVSTVVETNGCVAVIDSSLASNSSYAVYVDTAELRDGSSLNISGSDITTDAYGGMYLASVLVSNMSTLEASVLSLRPRSSLGSPARGNLWNGGDVIVVNRSAVRVTFSGPLSTGAALPSWVMSSGSVIYALAVDVLGNSSFVFVQAGLDVVRQAASDSTTAYAFQGLRLVESSFEFRGAPAALHSRGAPLPRVQWSGMILIIVSSSVLKSNVSIAAITATADGYTSVPRAVVIQDTTVSDASVVLVSSVNVTFGSTPSSAAFGGANGVLLYQCTLQDSSLLTVRNTTLSIPLCGGSGTGAGGAVFIHGATVRRDSGIHVIGVLVDAPLCRQAAVAFTSCSIAGGVSSRALVAVSAVVTNGNHLAVVFQDTSFAAALVSVYDVMLTEASARYVLCDVISLTMTSRLAIDTLRTNAQYFAQRPLMILNNLTVVNSSVDFVALSCRGAACVDAYDTTLSTNASLAVHASTLQSSLSALLFRNVVVSGNSSVVVSASVVESVGTASLLPGVVLNLSGSVTDSSVHVLASNLLRYAHSCESLYVLTSLRVVNSNVTLSGAVQQTTCGPLQLDGVYLNNSSVVVSGAEAVAVLRSGGLLTLNNVSMRRSSTLVVGAWSAQSTSAATLLSLTGVSLQQRSQLVLQHVAARNVSGGLINMEAFEIRQGSMVVLFNVSYAGTALDTGCAAVCTCSPLVALRGGLIADDASELCVDNVSAVAALQHGGLLLVSNVTVRSGGRLVLLPNSSISANATASAAQVTVADSLFVGPSSMFTLLTHATVVVADRTSAGGSVPLCGTGSTPVVALRNVSIASCETVELLTRAQVSVESLHGSGVEVVAVSNGSRFTDSTVRVLCGAEVVSSAAIAAAWPVSSVVRLDTDAATSWDNATVVVDTLRVLQTFFVVGVPRGPPREPHVAAMTAPAAVLARFVGAGEDAVCVFAAAGRRSALRVIDTYVQVVGLVPSMGSAYVVSYDGWPARFLDCSVTNVTAVGAGFLHAAASSPMLWLAGAQRCSATRAPRGVVVESLRSAYATNGSSGVVLLNASSWRSANTTLNVTLADTRLTSGPSLDVSRSAWGLGFMPVPLLLLIDDEGGNTSWGNSTVVPLRLWDVVVDDCAAAGFVPFLSMSGDPLRPAATVSVYCTRWGDVRESVQMVDGRSATVRSVRYTWVNAATLRGAAAFRTSIALYPFSVVNRTLMCMGVSATKSFTVTRRFHSATFVPTSTFERPETLSQSSSLSNSDRVAPLRASFHSLRNDYVAASTAATVISSITGLLSAGFVSKRTLVIARLGIVGCESVGDASELLDAPVSAVESPLQLSVAASRSGAHHRGAVVGNVAIWVAVFFAVALVALLWLLWHRSPVSVSNVLTFGRLPGVLFCVVPLLLQQVVVSTAVLLSVAPSSLDAAICAVGVVAVIGLTALSLWVVRECGNRDLRGVDNRPWPSWRQCATRHRGLNAVLRYATAVRCTWVSATRRRDELWDRRSQFVRRCGVMYNGYRWPMRGWLIVELLVTPALATIGGIVPESRRTCEGLRWGAAAVALGYAAALAVCRPMNTRLDALVVTVLSFAQCVVALCSALDVAPSVVSGIATFLSWFEVVMAVAGFVGLLWSRLWASEREHEVGAEAVVQAWGADDADQRYSFDSSVEAKLRTAPQASKRRASEVKLPSPSSRHERAVEMPHESIVDLTALIKAICRSQQQTTLHEDLWCV